MSTLTRKAYADMFGPTVKDRIRLADTNLILEIEKDYTRYGDEVKFGGGKVIRDGQDQSQLSTKDTVDTVITNAVVVDYTGIYKADIGIKDGRIYKIGKSGNPDIQNDIDFAIGAGTEVISAEGMIVTAGGIDSHVHYISPQQAEEAIESGITTFIGGGTGPATGTNATNLAPGIWNIQRILESAEDLPVNLGVLGKGNSSKPDALEEQIKAGACGLKLHEDWGSTPSAIDTCLGQADKYDVQVCIHTDSLNESGFVEDTIKSFKNRTIHTYHTEGAGGGHAPDIITACGELNVLPSSTTPTCPYTVNTVDEHLDMLMVCHHLDKKIKEDVAFAKSRIRANTIAAEDILQDMGAISMFSSDSQAMGRVGEVIMRTWQTANKMKNDFGPLPEDSERNDNFRIKRYIAKYTINPAITHGISHEVGSIEEGKMADIILWKPAFFGVKPEIVVKGGFISYALMGDINGSIPTPEPRYYRPMFGALGKARFSTRMTFISQVALEEGVPAKLGLQSKIGVVKHCRGLTKKDMKLNDYLPKISVNHTTYEVYADGKLLTSAPAKEVALGQKYFLF